MTGRPPGATAADAALVQGVLREVARRIVGQEPLVERLLICLLTGGHVLLEGVPGLAKTLTVRTLAETVRSTFQRIQFTPDLLPADVVGTQLYDQASGSFRIKHGPVFANILLADEINRAPAKVQAALLEAMQEHQVTIGGTTFLLPEPFLVLATQNPIEQEGTYPLPEAQLDRFLLQIDVGYPDLDSERRMLLATTGSGEERATQAISASDLLAAQRLIRRIPVGESVVEAILTMVRAGRPESSDIDAVQRHVVWGPGPRASQALMLACRARAVLDGRLAPSIDDVAALAKPVLRHRMAVSFAARADGLTVDGVIGKLVERLS